MDRRRSFSDGMFLWTRQHTAGLSIAVLGLLVIVGLGGWVLGRRSRVGSG